MIFQDNILYLHYADLVPRLFSLNTVRSAKQRGSIKTKGRGGNGREVLIEYESLPSRWKASIKDHYGDIYTYCSAQIIKPHLHCIEKDEQTIKDFITSNEEYLPIEVQEQYKTACSYLRLMLTHKRVNQIKKLGFPSKGQFTEAIQRLIKAEGIKLPNNYSNLKRKMREYEKEGALAVISSRWGNSNSSKITPEIERWMVLEMCSTRLTPEQIHPRYLKVAEELGFRTDISKEAFKHRLNQPHLKQIIEIKRYGRKEIRSKKGQTFKIAPPVYSDDYWQGDGTAIDLAFREGSKIGISTVYVVVDTLSECFLGWSARPVKNSEDFTLQLEAYRNAVRKTAARPYQIKYDNQKGHKTAVAQAFYKELAVHHFASRAYRSSSRRIEGIFGRFQKQILAEYPFWTGYGRHTSSKIENWYDEDKMKRNLHHLPDWDELMQLFEVIVNDWNEARHPRYEWSRAQVYESNKDPKAKKLNAFEMIDLFREMSAPIKYQPNGITIRRKDIIKTYVVYNDEGMVDYKFRERYLGKRFHIKYDPEFELSEVDLYAEKPDGSLYYVATASEPRETPDVLKYLKPGDRAYVEAELANEDKYYDRLEAKAEELGYDETEVMKDWRQKISPKSTRTQTRTSKLVETASTADDWLDQL